MLTEDENPSRYTAKEIERAIDLTLQRSNVAFYKTSFMCNTYIGKYKMGDMEGELAQLEEAFVVMTPNSDIREDLLEVAAGLCDRFGIGDW